MNGALKILTDFGAGEILILLFVVSYYELRFKNMNKKQTETDYNVISLENDTLKNVNEVRSESQKRLDYIVDKLHTGEASTEEVQALLTKSMIALKADSQEQWAKMNAELDRFDSELMDNLVKAIPREMHAVLGHNLEELRGDLNAFMKETRMRFTDDHKGNGAERQAIWGVVHPLKEEIQEIRSVYDKNFKNIEKDFEWQNEKLERHMGRIFEHLASAWSGTGPITAEKEVSIQDQLVDILKEDGVIPKEKTGNSGDLLNHVYFGPIETMEETHERIFGPIEPMEMLETDTKSDDLNIEEMDEEDPEKHVDLVPINDDWKNVIHVVEAREEKL